LLVSTAAPALAHDRGRGKHKGKHKSHAVRHWDSRHRDRIVFVRPHAARSRNVVIFHNRFDGRPYGWSRGRKTGWGHCNLPPGQAKKYGCSPAFLRRSVLVRYPIRYYPIYGYQYRLVRVPIDYRGWYAIDGRNRLWVDDYGRFWRDDHARFRLTIVAD